MPVTLLSARLHLLRFWGLTQTRAAALARVHEGCVPLFPKGEVRPYALEIVDGERPRSSPEGRTAAGIPAPHQAEVRVGPQEAWVAVLLHQPVDCALRCVKGADDGPFNILACGFFGFKVQIHLEDEKKCISSTHVHALLCYCP